MAYLSEEKYQKTRRKIKRTSLLILIIGLLVGGTVIGLGLKNNMEIEAKYSKEAIELLESKVAEEREELLTLREELLNKGVEYDSGANWDDGDTYDLKILTDILDPSFSYWKFDEYKDNPLTADYCDLKEELDKIDDDGHHKRFEMSRSTPYFIFGAFICFASGMFALMAYTTAKRREILAFTAQQAMPVVKEGAEAMGPTLGKIAKDVKDALDDKDE